MRWHTSECWCSCVHVELGSWHSLWLHTKSVHARDVIDLAAAARNRRRLVARKPQRLHAAPPPGAPDFGAAATAGPIARSAGAPIATYRGALLRAAHAALRAANLANVGALAGRARRAGVARRVEVRRADAQAVLEGRVLAREALGCLGHAVRRVLPGVSIARRARHIACDLALGGGTESGLRDECALGGDEAAQREDILNGCLSERMSLRKTPRRSSSQGLAKNIASSAPRNAKVRMHQHARRSLSRHLTVDMLPCFCFRSALYTLFLACLLVPAACDSGSGSGSGDDVGRAVIIIVVVVLLVALLGGMAWRKMKAAPERRRRRSSSLGAIKVEESGGPSVQV